MNQEINIHADIIMVHYKHAYNIISVIIFESCIIYIIIIYIIFPCLQIH